MFRLLRAAFAGSLVLALLLLVQVPGVVPSPLLADPPVSARGAEALGSVGPGQRGAVASESEICSRHGTEMLLMGGNAADAVSFFLTCCVGLAGVVWRTNRWM